MPATLETLEKQINSGEGLASIVRTMKALAATNVRQYEKAVESLDDYFRTVELGLSVVLASRGQNFQPLLPDPRKPVLLIIFGSDHGLAGRFNEQIVSFALDDYGTETGESAWPPHNRIIACVGEQAFSRVAGARRDVSEKFNVPISMSGITAAVLELLERIEQWREKKAVSSVLLFYNRPLSAAGFRSHAETLLPVNLAALRRKKMEWASRSLPTFTMPAPRLLSALLRQYFFVSLYRAYALSLAAENASRLAAMQAAEKNIRERLDELKTAYQQERQTAITEELLDIVSGFKALRRKVDAGMGLSAFPGILISG
ncbi:MAG: F0F1 ATP synthase subunit gamma [Bacillota bacterium]